MNDNLQYFAFYGWDPAGQLAVGVNILRSSSLSVLAEQFALHGTRGLLDGPGVLLRGDYTFESGGLTSDWREVATSFASAAAPFVANGTIIGINLGDEYVCSGVPLANMSAVADVVRAELGSSAMVYANECGGSAQTGGTIRGCYKSQCRDEWAWPRVPPALSHISVDAYDEGNTGGEVDKARGHYEAVIYPRLSAEQRVLVVPGVFASSAEGCAPLRCPLEEQEDAVVAKLKNYLAWGRADARVVGFHPWHWANRSASMAVPISTAATPMTTAARAAP